jgi:nicotinamide mononucleotide transporter
MQAFISLISNWFFSNYIELFATISGLLYIYFSVKQNVLLWFFGIITSALYIFVYYNSKFYADMSLQFYYLAISFYGWYFWVFYKNKEEKEFPVSKTNFKEAFIYITITILLFAIYSVILLQTDSNIVYWDSFTTAAGITATWMLVKKKIEQWIIWIIVDIVSIVLYLNKELYLTVILFIVYTILAFVGYFAWKKNLAVKV